LPCGLILSPQRKRKRKTPIVHGNISLSWDMKAALSNYVIHIHIFVPLVNENKEIYWPWVPMLKVRVGEQERSYCYYTPVPQQLSLSSLQSLEAPHFPAQATYVGFRV
jgi:hypothetical protein